MRHYFLVAVDVRDQISKTLVTNYVQSAIARYDRVVQRHEKNSGYFDGVKATFVVRSLDYYEEKSDIIRETIQNVKNVQSAIDLTCAIMEKSVGTTEI